MEFREKEWEAEVFVSALLAHICINLGIIHELA